MKLANILIVYRKELRDQLRDRRTLLSMIIIPTLAIPLLSAVVTAVGLKVGREMAATPPSVAIVGGEDSPRVRQALLAHDKFKIEPAAIDWKQRISDKKLRALVELPNGFDAAIARGETATVKIYNYQGEVRSDRAVGELRRFLAGYGDQVIAARLAERGLPMATIKPLDVKAENVAPPEKVGGNLIGGIIPYLFLILAFTGAMYPAMDLTAGEKERGTMETLLCSPVARSEIVLGKFLMILTASLGTVACSFVSMTTTVVVGGQYILQRVGNARAAGNITQFLTLDPAGLLGVVGVVLPMVVLFAAVLFTISLFAKSFKEAQSYVSPLLIVILMPAMMALMPGIDLNPRLALVPILNVSLASKELVSGVWHWDYLALIFGSTCLYAAAALFFAVKMFNREDVIFRA
jgi:sodium transport system permease protein